MQVERTPCLGGLNAKRARFVLPFLHFILAPLNCHCSFNPCLPSHLTSSDFAQRSPPPQP